MGKCSVISSFKLEHIIIILSETVADMEVVYLLALKAKKVIDHMMI